jgi:hypothetical protein
MADLALPDRHSQVGLSTTCDTIAFSRLAARTNPMDTAASKSSQAPSPAIVSPDRRLTVTAHRFIVYFYR